MFQSQETLPLINLSNKPFAPKDVDGLHLVIDLRKFVMLYNALRGVSYPPVIIDGQDNLGRRHIVQGGFLAAALASHGLMHVPVINSPSRIALETELTRCSSFREALLNSMKGVPSEFCGVDVVHSLVREGMMIRHELKGKDGRYLMEYIPLQTLAGKGKEN